MHSRTGIYFTALALESNEVVHVTLLFSGKALEAVGDAQQHAVELSATDL